MAGFPPFPRSAGPQSFRNSTVHRAWPRHLNRHSPVSRPASSEDGIRQFLAKQDTQELLKDDRTLRHFLACISPEDAYEFSLVSSPTTKVRERVAERFAVFEQLCNAMENRDAAPDLMPELVDRIVALGVNKDHGDLFPLIVKAVLHRDDPKHDFWNYRNHEGLPPLAIAVAAGHVDAVMFLHAILPARYSLCRPRTPTRLSVNAQLGMPIDKLAGPYVTMSSLQFAVKIRAPRDIISCFAKSPLLHARKNRDTPLIMAIKEGLRDHVNWLRLADWPGPKSTRIACDGLLPLSLAIKLGHVGIMKDLVLDDEGRWQKYADRSLAVLKQPDGKDAMQVLAEAWPLLDDDARCEILGILNVMVNDFDDFTLRIFKLGIELAKKNGDYSLLRRCALVECEEELYLNFREHFLFLITQNDIKIVDLLIEAEIFDDKDNLDASKRNLVAALEEAERIGATEIHDRLKALERAAPTSRPADPTNLEPSIDLDL